MPRWTLWLLGYPAQALARLHEALALAHELSHPYSLAFAQCWAAFVSQLRRDVPAVHEQAEAAVALATEQGFPFWVAMGTILRGWALAMQGQGEEGMAQVRQGIAAWRATGAALRVPYFCTLLADVSAHLGHTEDGLQALAEAHTLVEQHEERYWEAEVSSPPGRLAPAAAGDAAGGGGSLVAAGPGRRPPPGGEIAGAAGRHEPELACGSSRASAPKPATLLAPIYGWFTEGFDTADLQEAKALLEELAG